MKPKDVHTVLAKHMLVDGLDLVFDLRKSHGCFIFDAKTDAFYLDFAMGFGSVPLGYNHPKLFDPEFLLKLAYVATNKIANSDYYTVEMAEFVDTFSRVAIPDYLPHLFMIDGGGPAVDNAIKTAIDWKVRKRGFVGNYPKIIYFEHAFHGRTGYALSVTHTHDERKTKRFPRFDWLCMPTPKVRFPLQPNLDSVEQFEKIVVTRIKNTLEEYKNRNNVAAIIIEPIQGEGGDNHFRKEFFQELRAIANEEDILLIFDEVQTGVGSTGKMWAHEHFDVKPDIVVFGKKIQVAGILCGPKIDEAEDNVFVESSRIGSTFGGNLVDMVRAQKILEIMEEDELVANAAKQGEYFLGELHEGLPQIDNIRGRGLMIAFDLPTEAIRNKVREELYAERFIVLACGEKSIRFRPPLTVARRDIDLAMDILRRVL